MNNHDLARQAAESIYDHDGTRVCPDIIADIYAHAMDELERLRRQVEFVKRESLLAIADSQGRHEETKCLLCNGQWYVECSPRHATDCPHAKEAT